MRWYLLLSVLFTGCGSSAPTVPSDTTATPQSDCDSYCALIGLRCGKAALQYATWDSCQSVCSGFSTAGQAGDTTGNTLQCRATYLHAARQRPVTFCPTAGPSGGDACK